MVLVPLLNPKFATVLATLCVRTSGSGREVALYVCLPPVYNFRTLSPGAAICHPYFGEDLGDGQDWALRNVRRRQCTSKIQSLHREDHDEATGISQSSRRRDRDVHGSGAGHRPVDARVEMA